MTALQVKFGVVTVLAFAGALAAAYALTFSNPTIGSTSLLNAGGAVMTMFGIASVVLAFFVLPDGTEIKGGSK